MKIEFLKLSSERYPVKDFILALDIKARNKIIRRLEMFDENPIAFIRHSGMFSKMTGHEKHSLSEIRILFNKISYRILTCLHNDTCYLVHAFKKKENKTRQSDIDTAIGRIKSYIIINTKNGY